MTNPVYGPWSGKGAGHEVGVDTLIKDIEILGCEEITIPLKMITDLAAAVHF